MVLEPSSTDGSASPEQKGEVVLQPQWNALKVGDAVHVHDDTGALVPAVVTMVTATATDAGGSNEVTVRVEDGDECFYLWPSEADVHPDPVEPSESCAHCRLLPL